MEQGVILPDHAAERRGKPTFNKAGHPCGTIWPALLFVRLSWGVCLLFRFLLILALGAVLAEYCRVQSVYQFLRLFAAVGFCCFPVDADEPFVNLRQRCVTSGTSEDRMRRDNYASDMLKIGQ